MSEKQEYEVTVLFDASSYAAVVASDPIEAADLALEATAGHQNLCHQCSDTLETADALGCLVYLNGKQVADTTWHGERIEDLKEQNKALKQELADIKAARVPVAYEVWWGLEDMRPCNEVFRYFRDAEALAKTIKSQTEIRPLYR